MAHLQLLSRQGCPACAQASTDLAELLAAPELARIGLEIIDVDADGNRALRAEYGDQLPVLLIDGAEHSFWGIDIDRLRRDLGVRFSPDRQPE